MLAETNIALWKKREDYDLSKDFWPWACRFGKMQVLAYRKRMQRDRLVFGEDVINLLATEAEPLRASNDKALAALKTCLDAVENDRREILWFRYRDGESVKDIANKTGRSAGAMADLLYRLRLQLAACVEKKLVALE